MTFHDTVFNHLLFCLVVKNNHSHRTLPEFLTTRIISRRWGHSNTSYLKSVIADLQMSLFLNVTFPILLTLLKMSYRMLNSDVD